MSVEPASVSVSEPASVGGALTRYPIEFSKNSKTFFACCGNTIRVLSTATGRPVATLHGHEEEVTVVVRNDNDSSQVFSASLDGTVRCWNTTTGACLRKWDVGFPILHLCTSKGIKGRLIVNVDPKYHSTTTRSSCRVMCLDLDSGDVSPLYKSRDCKDLTVDPSGKYVISVSGHSVFIYSLADKTLIKHHHVRALRTVCCHPTDAYIATGDEMGMVILWYKYELAETVVTSSLHWHAHQVSATVFSDDGAYLLTGGEEAVLVLWQLDTGHRQYLPRLGSAIRHIALSGNGSYYGVACADNAIRLVGAISSKVEQTAVGLQRAHLIEHIPKHLFTRIGVDPLTNGVVIDGVPGKVQLYNVFEDSHIRTIDITGRNVISRTDDAVAIPPRVEFSVFNHDGTWLATVERITDGKHSERVCLKLWRFDLERNTFVLNTRVNDAHKGSITSVKFHPTKNILATASSDHTFKLWDAVERSVDNTIAQRHRKSEKGDDVEQDEGDSETKKLYSWRCLSVGSYKKFAVHDVAFSADGSLLAVTYGQIVTLWEVATLRLVHTLVHPDPSEHILLVDFLSEGPFLVATSSRRVFVWNLLTVQISWSYGLPAVNMVAVPGTSRFVVYVHDRSAKAEELKKQRALEAASNGKKKKKHKKDRTVDNEKSHRVLVEFDALSPRPLHVWNASDMEETRMGNRIQSEMCCCTPRRPNLGISGPAIVYVTRGLQLKYRVLGEAGESLLQNGSVEAEEAAASEEERVSDFKQLYGNGDVTPAAVLNGRKPSGVVAPSRQRESGLDNASHLIPQLDSVFGSFMSSVAQPKVEKAKFKKFNGMEQKNSIAAQLQIPATPLSSKNRRNSQKRKSVAADNGTAGSTDPTSSMNVEKESNGFLDTMADFFSAPPATKKSSKKHKTSKSPKLNGVSTPSKTPSKGSKTPKSSRRTRGSKKSA